MWVRIPPLSVITIVDDNDKMVKNFIGDDNDKMVKNFN